MSKLVLHSQRDRNFYLSGSIARQDFNPNHRYHLDSENQTPVVTLMNELGLLGGEEQSLSKTTEVAKETSNQTTSPIEVLLALSLYFTIPKCG